MLATELRHANGRFTCPVPTSARTRGVISFLRHRWLPLAAAAFSVGACSQKAQNETGEAADAVAADVNATMGEAVDDVKTAGDRAFGAAENAADRAGDHIENATDRAGAAIDRGAAKADAAADNAQREAGQELEKAGRDMQR